MGQVIPNIYDTFTNEGRRGTCVASPVRKTHQEDLGLGGLVHEEAHPCFSYFVQIPLNLFIYLSTTEGPCGHLHRR